MPRRGGGGGGGAGQGYRSHGSKDVSKGGDGARKEQGRGGSQDRETRISKLVSYVLRHGAKKEGLRIDESGFVNVGELLSWRRLSSLSVTFPEIVSMVATNSKQRFALEPLSSPLEPTSTTTTSFTTSSSISSSPSPFPDPLNPCHHHIRATQGHSLPIASANLLTPILLSDADCPEEVVHGTYEARWKLILNSGGLKPMGRQHVHFARGMPAAADNKSDLRTVMTTGSSSPPPLHPPSPLSSSTVHNTTITTPPPPPQEEEEEEEEQQQQQQQQQQQPPPPPKIISGMRDIATVLIWVDLKRSLRDGGLEWWKSANGVILTAGDRDGKVGLEWVRRVERRGRGNENGKGVKEGEREVIWTGSSS